MCPLYLQQQQRLLHHPLIRGGVGAEALRVFLTAWTTMGHQTGQCRSIGRYDVVVGPWGVNQMFEALSVAVALDGIAVSAHTSVHNVL